MLNRLASEDWARDLLDQLYLDVEIQAWADNVDAITNHCDSNGVSLAQCDNVVLIEDLWVKGARFTAKRGTAVRDISLVQDNNDHIEGRVAGQRIAILTEFVIKKYRYNILTGAHYSWVSPIEIIVKRRLYA